MIASIVTSIVFMGTFVALSSGAMYYPSAKNRRIAMGKTNDVYGEFDDMPALVHEDDELQIYAHPSHPNGKLLASMNTGKVCQEILFAADIGRATDLFDQWLEDSAKENYEVPKHSRLNINHVDPQFVAGELMVQRMFQMWQTHPRWYNYSVMPTFRNITKDPFLAPLITQPATHAVLDAAIRYGNPQDRSDIMDWLVSSNHPGFDGVQPSFFNLIKKNNSQLITVDEVRKYFKMWYGDDRIINDWIEQSNAAGNYKIFTEYLTRIRRNSHLSIRRHSSSNFGEIIRLVDAAKVKVDRNRAFIYKRPEMNYFAAGTFRALMDIIQAEMVKMYRKTGCDCTWYVDIARRMWDYMADLGISDERKHGHTVKGKMGEILRFCYQQ